MHPRMCISDCNSVGLGSDAKAIPYGARVRYFYTSIKVLLPDQLFEF